MIRRVNTLSSLGAAETLCGLAFLAYAASSTVWSSANPWSLLYAIGYWASLSAVFVVAPRIHPQQIWLWYCAILTANLSAALLTLGYSPYGLFGNPNYFGCALALGLAGALAYRLWVFIPVLIFGLFYCQSRGAILGAAAVGFIWLWRRDRVWALALALLSLAAVLALSADRGASLTQRIGIWQDTINHLTFFGSGLGSFADAYAAFAIHTNSTLQNAPHTYNDMLELIFELGVGVVFIWVAVVLWVEGLPQSDRLIVLCFAVLSFSFFPLFVPTVGHLFAFTLGLSRRTERKTYALAPHATALS